MKRGILLIGFSFWCYVLFGQEPRLVLPIGHIGYIKNAHFSPDCTKVVSVSTDHTVKIWDVQTGTLLADIGEDRNYAFDASFSPDGNKIVTASEIKKTKLFDMKTCTLLTELNTQTYDENVSLKFSNDSKKIIVACTDATAKIWNVQTGMLLADLRGHKRALSDASFSPDGKKVITASWDKTAKIWDVQTGAMLISLKGHKDWLTKASFSPDGTKIVTASMDGTAKIWDVQTGELLKNLTGHIKKVLDASFSLDNKRILTLSEDSTAKIWDVKTGFLLFDIKSKNWGVRTASFSSDGKKIVIGLGCYQGRDTVKICDGQTGSLMVKFSIDGRVTYTSFSPDNHKILAASSSFDQGVLIRVWDVQTGAMTSVLKGHTKFDNIDIVGFGLKEKFQSFKKPKIWDAPTGATLADLKGRTNLHNNFTSSFDGKKNISTYGEDLKIWDAQSNTLLAVCECGSAIFSATFSPDSRKIVVALYDGSAKVWDAKTFRLLTNLKGHTDYVQKASFSFDNKKIVTASNDGTAKIWDAETGKMLVNIEGHISGLIDATFSPDGSKILTASWDGTARLWDGQTGKRLAELGEVSTNTVNEATFSPDGTKIVTASIDHTAKIWETQTGALIASLEGHTASVEEAVFTPDGKNIVTTSADNSAKIWDVKSGKLLETFYCIDSTDYFRQISSGYYMCSPNAAKLVHYVTKDLKVITFEQLDIKYNRPDKVLEAIGSTDTALIHAYRKAYDKRIKKLGIDTTQFKSGYSIPKSDFLNREQIEKKPEKIKNQLNLHIFASDSTYKLTRFNVWVNHVPIYGIRGLSLKNLNRFNLDTSVKITLSQGENRIETSVINVNGTESYHIPLFVKYKPVKPLDSTFHFIGIGINNFADKNYNLQWSVKDIRDLANRFREKYKDRCTIDTLFNVDVTNDNIMSFKKKLLKSSVNDKVVLAYSGHGLLSRDYDYFLSTYNVNFNDPTKNGLPYDALEGLLDSIPARNKLMLIDACHSGEIDKDEMNRYTETKNERNKMNVSDYGHKGAKIEFAEKSNLSMQSSFELMKHLFVYVGKSTGTTIISAAGGVQYALEKNDLKNGVFTYCILEDMKKNQNINISDLKLYVNKRVTELTAGMQVPTTRNETDIIDWQVW